MFKPMEAARAAKKFRSFDELARRLASAASDLEWPGTRSLAVKIGEIDRDRKVWWLKRPRHAAALAALLEVPEGDLGLHGASEESVFEFTSFPELQPIALARETPCDIGIVADADGSTRGNELAFWLSPSPPRHGGRGPERPTSWLEFRPGGGLSLFWAALCAHTRHDYIRTRNLAGIRERLREPGNLMLLLERPCEEDDLAALGEAHPDLNLLIIAPFGGPELDSDAPSTWVPSWSVMTGQANERVLAMRNPVDTWSAIARYQWRLHDDWQARLLRWVEKRIERTTGDTLFTAQGVANWLAGFPPGWEFVKGPADLLAVCRLCHLSRETALPRVTDVDAGQRLLMRITGANGALSRRFISLVARRLEARDVPWAGSLDERGWNAMEGASDWVPDASTLLEIANAASVTARRKRAAALAEQLQANGTAPLLKAGLLAETRDGTLMLAPQFLVELIARDFLMRVIRDEPVERWALLCFDRERRTLVDAALGSMAAADLLGVLDRLRRLPADSLAAIAAAEAMFWTIGNRLCGASMVPPVFACLADMLLPRLMSEDGFPGLWTRTLEHDDDRLEWCAICWAWSLWCDAPIDIPASASWHFPGWAPGLAADEPCCLWLPAPPEHAVAPDKWLRLAALSAQLARRLAQPPAAPPDVLMPSLLMEGLQGRWSIDVNWLSGIVGCDGTRPVALFENLALDELERIGSNAAKCLLPVLMDYLIADPGSGIRSIHFHRSRICTWVLAHVSLADVTSVLDERQTGVFWQFPHALPPALLLEMLENPPASRKAGMRVCLDAIRALNAEHVDTLSHLLASELLGPTAALRLWKVAPEAAEHLLHASPRQHSRASYRLLFECAPSERIGSVVRAILLHRDVLTDDERMEWARQSLPSAGPDAEILGGILGLG